jgi:hypothetical protein
VKASLVSLGLAAMPLLAWAADPAVAPAQAATAAPVAVQPAVTAPPAVTARAAAPAAAKPTPAVSASRSAARAQDRVELENTQITGNRELPRVMYVVPWKRPDLGDLGGKPARSLLDELLEPVDRDVFQRQNRYYNALQPDAADTVSAPAPAAAAGDEK